jgi:signal transduction histidine kinase
MKLLRAGRLTPVFKPKRYTTYVAILIIAAGVASALFAALSSNYQKREYLIGRAQTISDTLALEDIAKLKGTQADLSNPAYNNLKQRLQQVRGSNLDIQRILLFTKDGEQIEVATDAQTSDGVGYESPGTHFSLASDALKLTFNSSSPQHDNLFSDELGRWMSAYTPVYDVQSGQTVAAVGVFVDAKSYYLEIAIYALVPLLLAAIPLAGLLRDIKIQAKEHEILHLKNQFISIASHELRSPLTGMLWGIQSLQSSKKLTPRQEDLLHDMYKSTESSLSTVNEILDQSIFERGQSHTLQQDIVDMTAVMSQVMATLNLGAQEKKIEIVYGKTWPDHAYILGDVGALKRSLMNIVSNAIKYSPDASQVTIDYRKTDTKEHIIAVRDRGIGIPLDEQAKVLDGYYRASNASQVQAHGTGLGLWVTRMIIQEHGGRIWLNSAVGHGTTVSIALPVTEFAASRPSGESARSN